VKDFHVLLPLALAVAMRVQAATTVHIHIPEAITVEATVLIAATLPI
jgi:hypothetical protein